MAITKSAKKAHRQSLRRKKFNDVRRRALKEALKAVRLAPAGDNKALIAAYKAIDKAQKRGIIKKNTAARRKARVARLLAPQTSRSSTDRTPPSGGGDAGSTPAGRMS